MLFTLIPGCLNLSKMIKDTLPPFPKATHLTVLFYNLLLTFYCTKTENLGHKKRFIDFQLFFCLYLGVQDSCCMHDIFLLQQFRIHFPKSQNFSWVPTVTKVRMLIQQMALPKATFFLNQTGFWFFYKEPSNPYLRLHTHPNLLPKHTTPLLLLTLFGKAALHKLFGDWNTPHLTLTELDQCVSHQH